MTDLWTAALPDLPEWPLDLVAQRLHPSFHGDYQRWQTAILELPELTVDSVSYDATITVSAHIDADTREQLETGLQTLHPWRKGPFQIADVCIDTEWRSDMKWARLAEALDDLDGRRVLDIGCGNGYFGWRMLAAGAHEVIGIDPTILFCMQHRALQRYLKHPRHWVLPLRIEEIPSPIPGSSTSTFDTVFSMGVVYHRRDPQAHIQQLLDLTRPGGQIVLESIVTTRGPSFKPKSRYARMRNVWHIPSPAEMCEWLTTGGAENVRVIDVAKTSHQEQRSTPWMRFESLSECLDPADQSLTIEGYPAPERAIVTATKGGA